MDALKARLSKKRALPITITSTSTSAAPQLRTSSSNPNAPSLFSAMLQTKSLSGSTRTPTPNSNPTSTANPFFKENNINTNANVNEFSSSISHPTTTSSSSCSFLSSCNVHVEDTQMPDLNNWKNMILEENTTSNDGFTKPSSPKSQTSKSRTSVVSSISCSQLHNPPKFSNSPPFCFDKSLKSSLKFTCHPTTPPSISPNFVNANKEPYSVQSKAFSRFLHPSPSPTSPTIRFKAARMFYQHPAMHPLPFDVLKGRKQTQSQNQNQNTELEKFSKLRKSIKNRTQGSMGGLGSSVDVSSNNITNLVTSRQADWRQTFSALFYAYKSTLAPFYTISTHNVAIFTTTTTTSTTKTNSSKKAPKIILSSTKRPFRDLLTKHGCEFSDFSSKPFTEYVESERNKKLREELINLSSSTANNDNSIVVNERIEKKCEDQEKKPSTSSKICPTQITIVGGERAVSEASQQHNIH